MTFNFRAAVGLCAALALTGCMDLMKTGFNWDTPGASPEMRSFGPPVGMIRPGTSENVFVTSKAGLVGEQALAFMETEAPASDAQRTFLQSAQVKDTSAPVHVSWKGQFGSGGTLKVVLGFMGRPYVQMIFDDGDVFVAGRKLGRYLPGDHHVIYVTLDPDALSYSLTMTGDARMDISEVSGTVTDLNGSQGDQVIAEFSLESAGTERLVYVLDDVRVSHRPVN